MNVLVPESVPVMSMIDVLAFSVSVEATFQMFTPEPRASVHVPVPMFRVLVPDPAELNTPQDTFPTAVSVPLASVMRAPDPVPRLTESASV